MQKQLLRPGIGSAGRTARLSQTASCISPSFTPWRPQRALLSTALRSEATASGTAGSSSRAGPSTSSSLLPYLLTAGAGLAAYHAFIQDLRSTSLYHSITDSLVMPAIRMLSPEDAHNLAVKAAASGLTPVDPLLVSAAKAGAKDPTAALLQTSVWGRTFPSPIGLAAGFDKQAEAMEGLLNAGFGFVEVGSVTPLPQYGNPKPRMFRLSEDRAVINRFGFNSVGLAVVCGRLADFWAEKGRAASAAAGSSASSSSASPPPWLPGLQLEAPTALQDRPGSSRGLLGLNIGKNKLGDAISDYTVGCLALAPFADYLVINVSSPNTPGLRALQSKESLRELVLAVKAARDGLPWGGKQGEGKSGAEPAVLPVQLRQVLLQSAVDAFSGAASGKKKAEAAAAAGTDGSGSTASAAVQKRAEELVSKIEKAWGAALHQQLPHSASGTAAGAAAAAGTATVSSSPSTTTPATYRPCPPLLLKIAPDCTEQDVADICEVALELQLDGLIISNTTIQRPAYLRSKHAGETGGLSGKPLLEPSTRMLRQVYAQTQGRIPLIGVGGVSSGKDAYAKIRAGASLVQMYSALVYEGPGLVSRVKQELAECLREDGFSSVQEAVGADLRKKE